MVGIGSGAYCLTSERTMKVYTIVLALFFFFFAIFVQVVFVRVVRAICECFASTFACYASNLRALCELIFFSFCEYFASCFMF